MYGITDNLSAEGGTSLVTLVRAAPSYYGHLKYGFPIAKNLRGAVSIAHGGMVFPIIGFSANITTLNALLTYGNKERNLTFALGYNEGSTGFSWWWIEGRDGFHGMSYSLRGMTRVSKRLALITENWLLPGVRELVLSGGVRIMWRKIALNFLIIPDTKSGEQGLLLIEPFEKARHFSSI